MSGPLPTFCPRRPPTFSIFPLAILHNYHALSFSASVMCCFVFVWYLSVFLAACRKIHVSSCCPMVLVSCCSPHPWTSFLWGKSHFLFPLRISKFCCLFDA